MPSERRKTKMKKKMNKTLKKILKIGALALAVILIAGVCLFANALVGNPISKLLAQNTAKNYIEETYEGKNYELEGISYSFKDGYYHANVVSPDSIDTHFTLLINGFGKLVYDYYENNVTNGWNTAYRLEDDYRKTVKTIFDSGAFPYNAHIGYGELITIAPEDKDRPDVPEYAIITNELKLDAYYNVNELGKRAGKLTVYIADETVTAERLGEILLGARDCFDKAGVGFYAIDCVLEYPQEEGGNYRYGRVEVMEFLYSDIYAEGLTERVEAANEAAIAYHSAQDTEKAGEIVE